MLDFKLVLLLLLTSCGSALDRTFLSGCEAPQGEVGILIGGSVIEGHPALHGIHHSQCENRPGQISYGVEKHLGVRVLNQGIGGQTCADVLARWEEDVEAYKPKFVWLQCGHNDLTKGLDPKVALAEIIERARLSKTKVTLLTLGLDLDSPEKDEKILALNGWIRSQASDLIIIVDYYEWSKTPGADLADGIHPTEIGYKNFIDWVWR